MKQPSPRGEVSALVLTIIAGTTESQQDALERLGALVEAALSETADILHDDDLQLALFCLYELHYSGIDGAGDDWEWNPDLLRVRQQLEAAFERRVRDEVVLGDLPEATSEAVCAELFRMTGEDSGPSMSRYVAKSATNEQLHEFLVHKSIYQLKEADPHTWAIPRLAGRSKAALVEIQADEYGNGLPARMHSALFARTMRELGMDDAYGAYLDATPAITLAVNNLMSLFGLNRRLRGAIVGHLAAYEMTSSQPNRLYSRGFKRLGYGEDALEYFDEHVEADAVHEQIAGRDMAGGLVESDPRLLQDVLFGAAAGLAVDTLMTVHIMDAWEAGRSSLRASESMAS
ncbi:iron-containing redox enzyme family protein [Arthrobacter burdickii]|uniref:Iron-containing redox enzyme family protein n=1 Tax=Arthrobacter burdickii TaxID=3035920 RepID=A0ABT8JXN6_9MICC|nr:iron-containing redox enzyme family protein [Arthrobacter burdickii]MDN4609941.1 iron-containing redox enzyme family protein [Arthrobacter burdickii]